METRVQILALATMAVVCVSHVLHPRAWAEVFVRLREMGKPGAFVLAAINLPLGLVIVTFHNRWSGWAAAVTVLGWIWTVKGALYLMFPRVALWSLSSITVERASMFVVAGWLFLAITAALSAGLFLL